MKDKKLLKFISLVISILFLASCSKQQKSHGNKARKP